MRAPAAPARPRSLGAKSGAQTGPSVAHSGPLRGGHGDSHPVHFRWPLDG
ncbi:hypothetical protein [Nitrosomonas sp. Nm34]|nr:hypothetical protein [Nitrosomonas sp. Nm34]